MKKENEKTNRKISKSCKEIKEKKTKWGKQEYAKPLKGKITRIMKKKKECDEEEEECKKQQI